MEFKRIACLKCKHYQVTFDQTAPRGCKLYGFKSILMPYVLVKQSTGTDCTSFEEKIHKNSEKKEKIDYSNKKYWGEE